MGYQGHIVVPTSHERAEEIIEQITAKMVTKFGGYSRYDGSGGFAGENGVVEEDHVRLVVNTTNMSYESFKEYLAVEAIYVKDTLNEESVLIEVHDMNMELV